MQPGEYYQLAIVLTALFVAPFSSLARVIVLTWLVARVAWTAGASEELVNLIQHATAAALSIRYTRHNVNLFAWSIFAPLLAVDLVRLTSPTHSEGAAWWFTLGLALAQIGLLPFGMDHLAALEKWREWGRSLIRWPLWKESRIAGC